MDILLFVSAKFLWMVVRPESWILFLLLATVLSLHRNRVRTGKTLLLATFSVIRARARGFWFTPAFHMARAIGAFCRAGWRGVFPYPLDHRGLGGGDVGWDLAERLRTLDIAVKEWIGLIAYRLTGRTGNLIPGSCLE